MQARGRPHEIQRKRRCSSELDRVAGVQQTKCETISKFQINGMDQWREFSLGAEAMEPA